MTTRSASAVAATEIASAVRRWLDGLDTARRARATFPFESTERFAWDYRPGDRGGLSIAEMTAPQRASAMATLDAALSLRGAREVRAIIDLEPVLGELERHGYGETGLRRDPERYWFSVFGDPDRAEPWAWRVGGHHVAIELTLADGAVVGSAPSFLGANPATIPNGPGVGGRAIDGEEMLARTLLAGLTPGQRAIAVVDPVAPPDILSGNGRRAVVQGGPSGIRHAQLDLAQRDGLEGLVRHYLDRARPEVAAAEWARIVSAGLSPVTFAWAGPDVPGRGHYYAVRGPAFLIEYDNTQNGANHIHAVWRDLVNDWGEDRLAAHYRDAHVGGMEIRG
jgi:plasmid stabilization system protein ParE